MAADGVKQGAANLARTGRVAGETGDVVVGYLCIDRFAGGKHFGEKPEPRVWYVDYGGVDLKPATGIGCRSGCTAGQSIEDCCFSAIWPANDSDPHCFELIFMALLSH